jgi:hypothetical protein
MVNRERDNRLLDAVERRRCHLLQHDLKSGHSLLHEHYELNLVHDFRVRNHGVANGLHRQHNSYLFQLGKRPRWLDFLLQASHLLRWNGFNHSADRDLADARLHADQVCGA